MSSIVEVLLVAVLVGVALKLLKGVLKFVVGLIGLAVFAYVVFVAVRMIFGDLEVGIGGELGKISEYFPALIIVIDFFKDLWDDFIILIGI